MRSIASTLVAALVVLVAAYGSGVTAFPNPASLWNSTRPRTSSGGEYAVASATTFYFGRNYEIDGVDALTGELKYNISRTSAFEATNYSGLLATPDNWLYMSNGRETNAFLNGKHQWNATSERQNTGGVLSVSADGTRLAVAFNNAHVNVFDAKSGKEIFRYQANHAYQELPFPAAFANSTVAIAGDEGVIAAFDMTDGVGRWNKFMRATVLAPLVASADGAYFVVLSSTTSGSYTTANLTLYQADTGAYVNSIVIDTYFSSSSQSWTLTVAPMPWNRILLSTTTTSTAGSLYCIEIPTLTIKWITSVVVTLNPVFARDNVIVAVGGHQSYDDYVGFELGSGAIDWTLELRSYSQWSTTQTSEVVVALTSSGPLFAATGVQTGNGNPNANVRQAWSVPKSATVVEQQCANEAPGPCTTGCQTVKRPAICVEADESPVSQSKQWKRSLCTWTGVTTNLFTLQSSIVQGTSCTTGTIVYSTDQYPNECVVDRNFTSTVFETCA